MSAAKENKISKLENNPRRIHIWVIKSIRFCLGSKKDLKSYPLLINIAIFGKPAILAIKEM